MGWASEAHNSAPSTGTNQTCATLKDGQVQCWGANEFGQLGNGTNKMSAIPVTVSGITSATAVSVSSDSCALLFDGTVQCWGRQTQIDGDNVTTQNNLVPVAVAGTAGVTALANGGANACAMRWRNCVCQALPYNLHPSTTLARLQGSTGDR